MKDVSLGEAEPFKKAVGDIITSLSLPYFAVPVFGSTVIPLLIRFGNLIALSVSITSLPRALRSSSSLALEAFSYSAVFLDLKPVRSWSLSGSVSESPSAMFFVLGYLFKAYFKSPF